jgi:hypothetical protein
VARSEVVLASLGEALLERAGPLLADVVAGLVGPLDDLADMVGTYADLDATQQPNLLGQLAATRAPGDLDPAAQAAWIRAHPRWLRGTPAQLILAVRDAIGADATVVLVERDESPWHFTVRVYEDELGDITAVQVRDAALPQKPVGLIMHIDVVPGSP